MRGLPLRKFFIAVYFIVFSFSVFMIEMHSLANRSAMQRPVPILQSGHRVNVVALRPDGQLAVTGGSDGLLKLWDRKTGLLMRTIVAHSGSIMTLNFSRSGDRLVSGSDDGVIKVWHMPSGVQISAFQATKGVLSKAVFNGTADLVAICFNGRDDKPKPDDHPNTIKIFNVNGQLIRTLAEHTRPVINLDFSDDDTLVSASLDWTVKVWSAGSQRARLTIQAEANDNFLDISPDGKRVSVVTFYSTPTRQEFAVFDSQTGKRIKRFDAPESWGSSVMSGNSDYLLVTIEGNFKIFDIERNEVVTFVPGKGEFTDVAIDYDGKAVVFGGPSSPRFWPSTIASDQAEISLLGPTTGIAVSNDKRLIAWGSNNLIYLWDQSSAVLLSVLSGHTDAINEVAFSPDGRTLASCSSEQVKLWSTYDGSLVADLKIPRPPRVRATYWNGSQSVSFSPNGEYLATGELRVEEVRKDEYKEKLAIRVWDVRNRKLWNSFPMPETPRVKFERDGEKDGPFWIRSIAFSPNNRTIASDNGSNRVMLLDIKTATFRSLNPHRREVNSVAFNSNGKYLSSASFDRTIRVWDVSKLEMTQELRGHLGRVTSAKFSRDDASIISGSRDRTVKVWDIKSGASSDLPASHEGAVTSVNVSLDGSTIFSSGIDGRLNLWSAADKQLLATIVATAQDSWICFTPDGYYNGNNAQKYIAWQVGGEMHPGKEYAPTYARPNTVLARVSMRAVDNVAVTPAAPLPIRPPTPSEENRRVEVRMSLPGGRSKMMPLYKRSYALVIGNGAYDYWSTLTMVPRDIAAVTAALKEQGFEVVSFDEQGNTLHQPVINVRRQEFKRQLDLFTSEYGQDSENRLLIYYAGHGYTARLNNNRVMGYLVMVDAPKMPAVEVDHRLSTQDQTAIYKTSVNMQDILIFAQNMTARHVLFVFDSCFSGTVLSRPRDGGPKIPIYLTTDVAEPVREFLTAGDENQKVPDDGRFRWAFVEGIQGAADQWDRDNPDRKSTRLNSSHIPLS